MLASPADVAHALGLDDENELTASQQARVEGLLERVSRRFQREAGRTLTAGAVTVRALTVEGRVHLPDPPSGDTVTVTDLCGNTLEGVIEGDCVDVTRNGCPVATGEILVVEYTRDEPPQAAIDAVAAIVARHLTVEPGSPESKSTDLTAGVDFRQRLADWVSDTSLFTDEELAEARSYRYPVPNVIIHRL